MTTSEVKSEIAAQVLVQHPVVRPDERDVTPAERMARNMARIEGELAVASELGFNLGNRLTHCLEAIEEHLTSIDRYMETLAVARIDQQVADAKKAAEFNTIVTAICEAYLHKNQVEKAEAAKPRAAYGTTTFAPTKRPAADIISDHTSGPEDKE